jgi:hypothetical protein
VPTVDRGSVRIVTLYDDEHGFSPNYVQSLLAMIGHDLVGQQRIARGGWSLKHAKSYDIAAARNEATAEFLESDVEWMLFVDSDMGWEADALERLFDSADANLRPIVGGLCFGYSPVETGAGEANGPFRYPFPTLYWFNETDTDIGFQVMWNYRAGALNPVKATGAAFLLIHRGALETMRAKHGDTWWSRIKHPKAKSMWGEDTSFCARVGLCEIPVFVDTRVRTSLLKPIYVSDPGAARGRGNRRDRPGARPAASCRPVHAFTAGDYRPGARHRRHDRGRHRGDRRLASRRRRSSHHRPRPDHVRSEGERRLRRHYPAVDAARRFRCSVPSCVVGSCAVCRSGSRRQRCRHERRVERRRA